MALVRAKSGWMIALAFAATACQAPEEATTSANAPAPPAGPAWTAAVQSSAAIAADDIRQRIAILADDRFEGREPSTPVGETAADWIAAEMARLGLAPAGENGTFFQTVTLVEQTLDPAASSLSFTGADGAPLTARFAEDAVFWTKRPDPQLSLTDSDVVFAGYGVSAPEANWNDYAGLAAEGKTVIVLVNDPAWNVEGTPLFDGRAMTYYGRWTYKFEEGARQKAGAVLIVHETAAASYGWDVVRNSWTGPQYDIARADGNSGRAVLEGWISQDFARQLFAAAGENFDQWVAKANAPGFAPHSLGLRANAQLTSATKSTQSRNVMGKLAGASRPDEAVIYTAHWDHLGVDPNAPAGADRVYNGAVDNATGVAAILEIAEAFAGLPTRPARSALFLAVTAEESGLLGSEFFADNPLFPLAQIAGGVNIDAWLPNGPARDLAVIGKGGSELEDMLESVLAQTGRVASGDPNPPAGYYFRSDHFPLAKRGVPMLYADGGEDLREGGPAAGKAAAERYTKEAYHGLADNYDPAWNLDGMAEDAGVMFEVGRLLAESDAWPNWRAGNPFKAARDQSRNGQ